MKSILLEKLHNVVNQSSPIFPYMFMEILQLWKTANKIQFNAHEDNRMITFHSAFYCLLHPDVVFL